MKLLVDVPDDKYREFMEENAYEVIYDGYWVARAIAEGVPIKDEEFFSMLMKSVMTKEQFDEILQEVAKRPQGEWIPVSERLPDKNMPCLVSVGKFNFIQIAMYSNLMETIDHKIFYQGDYGKNNFQNITEYVNAWQPLPEPYKEGGAE